MHTTPYEMMFHNMLNDLEHTMRFNASQHHTGNVIDLEEGKDYKVMMTDKEKIALSFMILACIIIACGVGMMISAVVSMMK